MVDKAHVITCHQVCKEEEKPPLAQPADMVESDMVRDELLQTGNYGLLMATEHMTALHLGWHPASRHQASKLLAIYHIIETHLQRAALPIPDTGSNPIMPPIPTC